MKFVIEKAREIVNRGKNPANTWSQLRQWASKSQHPLAMKAAVFQFLDRYAKDPNAVRIIPEVLQNASHMSLDNDEKTRLESFAARASLSARTTVFNKKDIHATDMSPNRYSALNMYDIINSPVRPSKSMSDLRSARDALLHVNELVLSKAMPEYEPKEHDGTRPLGADKGEELVKSLLEKMKNHGNDYTPPPRIKSPVRKPAKTKKKLSKPKKKSPAKPKKKTAKKKVLRKKKIQKKPAKKSPKRVTVKKRPKKKPIQKRKKKPVKKISKKKISKKKVPRKRRK